MRMAGHPLGVRLLMNKEGAEHETNWKSGGGLRQASECAAAGRQRKGISNMLLLSLIGTYAALVLLVSSFTMLSVQQLTDAIEQKHRFDIIRKLGVERKECQKTARRQMYFWFGLPVLMAIVGSIGVFSYLLWSNYNEIIAYVLPSQIGIILTLSYISFIIVFGCYFVSTYYLFQRNIEKH